MHQIRYFIAVAKTLNFTRAADESHVAQPSLSRAIKKLEEELGGDLFRRERGLTHLTELGRLMLPRLTSCYEAALSAKTLAVSFKKGDCAPLRLGLSHTVNLQIFNLPLGELVKAFPGLELKFVRGTADRIGEHLKNGDVELAVACPLAQSWDRLESWVLFEEPFELAAHASHPVAQNPKVSMGDLAKLRLLPRGYSEQSADVDSVLRRHGISVANDDAIASDGDLLALLGANVGVSLMPASACNSDSLRFLTIDGLDLMRPVALYAVAGRQRSMAAAALVRLLRAANWKKLLSQVPGHRPGDRAAAKHSDASQVA